MILSLDIGNSQIYGGLFDGERLVLQFRKAATAGNSSDEIGLFLKAVLKENRFEGQKIDDIAFCSVVPDLIHSVRGACTKYFGVQPFLLKAGTKTGLRIKYRNPVEVGSDRIGNAVGAAKLFPGKNLILIDFGTATTFCAVTADKDYLGGLIVPGLRLSMEALEARTAQLPKVEIVAPPSVVARSTVESIQSGLYHGNLAMIRGLTEQIRREAFVGKEVFVVGTGGFSRLFESERVFDALVPELIHLGLKEALRLNREESGTKAKAQSPSAESLIR